MVLLPASKDGLYGYIDPATGAWAIDPIFDYAHNFYGDRAAVTFNDKDGFIDHRGNWLLQPQFDRLMHRFTNGRCIANQSLNGERWCDSLEGVIDEAGHMVVPYGKYSDIALYSEGLAIVKHHDGRFGAIHVDGNELIAPRFSLGCFGNGLASSVEQPGGLTGYVDRTGQFVIAPQFVEGCWFTEGVAPVRVCTQGAHGTIHGMYGAIRPDGTFAIEPTFDYLFQRSEGMTAYATRGWKHGYVDEQGNIVIKAQWHEALEFTCGLARVTLTEEDADEPQFRYINKAGVYVGPVIDGDADSFRDGYARVDLPDGRGYLNTRGEIVFEFE